MHTTMGWNDHVDWDLIEAIKQALEDDHLEEGTAAYGIAQQVRYKPSLPLNRSLMLPPAKACT